MRSLGVGQTSVIRSVIYMYVQYRVTGRKWKLATDVETRIGVACGLVVEVEEVALGVDGLRRVYLICCDRQLDEPWWLWVLHGVEEVLVATGFRGVHEVVDKGCVELQGDGVGRRKPSSWCLLSNNVVAAKLYVDGSVSATVQLAGGARIDPIIYTEKTGSAYTTRLLKRKPHISP